MRAMRVGAAALLVLLALLGARGASAEGPNAVIGNGDCTATELAANDDGSSPLVDLPFRINFFGSDYGSLYVNNNGNVTFERALSSYTPSGIVSSGIKLIAPFWADVDTRGPGSGTVHYGSISAGATEVSGHEAFCVNWLDVGYYGGHTDKLNSFQLVLVDRSDTGPGNFDIEMNYDKVQWETGDASGGSGGLGGTPVRIGYSNGSTAFELPGSGVSGAFLDSNTTTGLIHNSVGTLQPGRYVFPVRNGAAFGHSLSGHVWQNAPGAAVAGAIVQACPTPVDTPCRNAVTNTAGFYNFNNLPDSSSGSGVVDHDWTLVVHPPGGSGLSSGTLGPVPVTGAGGDVVDQDVVLTGPQPLPAGASISTPTRGTATSGVPTVYWGDPLTVSVPGCAGGTASAMLAVADGYSETIPLAEGPSGIYTGTFASPYPHHGDATISFTVCGVPGSFDLYIDPSGVVQNTHGGRVAGATVTLYRADEASGPFTAVPDGSAIMSPGNTRNPDTTDAAGHFGWDVLAGFYKVRAQAEDCHAPGDESTPYVESAVLAIPPPVTDLVLVLECAGDLVPPVVAAHDDVTAEATSAAGAAVTFTAPAATDDVDGPLPVTCDPASGSAFPLGDTEVDCSATDAAGNTGHSTFAVHVVDTTGPSVTVPGPVWANATSPAGAVVGYPAATATDLVDGSVAVACAPASGSTFGIGDTTVTCSATDAHGNPGSVSFTVHVSGAVEQLTALRDWVIARGLGPGSSLRDKLADLIVAAGTGGGSGACSGLRALDNEVRAQAGKKIPAADAARIRADVARIRAVLAC